MDRQRDPNQASVPRRRPRRERAPQHPPKGRLPLLLLSVAAVGAIVWITVFGASGSTPAKDPKAAPSRGKRTPRPAARRKPTVRLVGHVQRKDGAPVRGATVFVLPKKRLGSDRDGVDHEVTNAEGRWSLRTRTTVDCWIGVVAPGCRTAWLDGDTVDPSVQMFLIVEPASKITVTLVDGEGKPLAGQGVMVNPWPDSGAFYYLPGPKARLKEQYRVTNRRGEAVFSRGDDGPVTVTPDAPGWHAENGPVWLPDTTGDVRLTMRPMASLELRVRDAQTGAPISGLLTVEFFDPTQGTRHASFTESTQEPGILRLERSVPPGRYGLLVQREESEPWMRGAWVIPSAEGTHTLDVPLRAAQAKGTLQLTLAGNAAALPAGTRRRAPLTYVRRTDGRWNVRGWQPGAPELTDARHRSLTFVLEPGRYDVLIADVLSGRAALESGIEIKSGARQTVEVGMQPGQRGKLPALWKQGQIARRLIVTSASGARLPVFGATPGARVRAGRTLDVIGRAMAGSTIFLGPYPVDEFTLTLERGDGSKTETTFR